MDIRTAMDIPPEKLEPADRNFVGQIREHSWFRNSVLEEEGQPGFSYTTGFWLSTRQPELITCAMKSDVAHNVFWDLFRDAKAGRSLPIGTRTDEVFGNIPAYVFPVAKAHYPGHLGWSRWFYGGDDFPCLQVIWSDRDGLFPWQSGFDPAFVGLQPDLTENGWLASLAN